MVLCLQEGKKRGVKNRVEGEGGKACGMWRGVLLLAYVKVTCQGGRRAIFNSAQVSEEAFSPVDVP